MFYFIAFAQYIKSSSIENRLPDEIIFIISFQFLKMIIQNTGLCLFDGNGRTSALGASGLCTQSKLFTFNTPEDT